MSNAKKFLFCFSFAVASLFPFVSASIYPTQPIQATVWSADQPMLVSWVEDWKYPTLNLMSPFNVLLYWNTDTYLMQLASAVDPQSKSVQVTVPRSVLRDGGSKYMLRFITDKPTDTVIYTADFMIMPANTSASTSTSTTSTSTSTSTKTASGSGAAAAALTSGTQTSETGTKTSSKTSSTGTATVTISRTAIPSGVLPPPGPIPGGQAPLQGQRKNAGRRNVDIEKFKFRLVFIIWPVLMGITMAL